MNRENAVYKQTSIDPFQ